MTKLSLKVLNMKKVKKYIDLLKMFCYNNINLECILFTKTSELPITKVTGFC